LLVGRRHDNGARDLPLPQLDPVADPAVVVQDKRTVSACCEADAVEDGGLFIIDAAELRRRTPTMLKRSN